MNDAIYRIWMTMVFGAANPRVWTLTGNGTSAQEAYELLHSGTLPLTDSERMMIQKTTLSQAKEIYDFCQKQGWQVTPYDAEAFPDTLRNLYCPPLLLITQGAYELLEEEPSLTVVGTRRATPYSLKVTDQVVGGIARIGMVIVSGFAVGIDGAAHRAALKNGAGTIAVMGCGLNVDYPKEHGQLRADILKNGLLVTEYLPGTPPTGAHFPKRNRILAALSLGTLVIQAAAGSGALITADLAVELGRDVFCIPPADLFDRRYSGVARFLRDGAIPVFSHLDIVYEYYTTFAHKLSAQSMHDGATGEPSAVFAADPPNSPPAAVENKQKQEQPMQAETLPQPIRLPKQPQKRSIVLYLQEHGRSHADRLAEELPISPADLVLYLAELEMEGMITACFGKQYELNQKGVVSEELSPESC